MDEKSVQRAREAIRLRIPSLIILADYERLTPSLREEIVHAIKVHEEALEQRTLDKHFARELDSLQDQIQEHWSRVYKSCIDRAHLVADMGQYQLFLTDILLAEYTGAAFTDTGSIRWLQECAAQIKKAATDVSDEFRAIFHEAVVFPVEELLLNQSHVERRLLMAATDIDVPRALGGHIQYLIECGDWHDLAKFLYYDRELALSLFKYQQILSGLFDSGTSDRVLQGITSIQDKYFTDISSPTEYTTSKYAKDLGKVQQAPDTSHEITAMPSAVEHHKPSRDSPAPRNNAKSIFNAIAGGIKSLGTRSGTKQAAGKRVSVNATTDEKTPLVDEKKA